MKYAFIQHHRDEFRISSMCRVFGIHRSGFYAWMKTPICKRKKTDEALGELIRETFEESKGAYGSPRIHRALRRKGMRIGRKRVERLMRERGISAKIKRRRRRFESGKPDQTAPNLVARDFKVSNSNRVWTSDITYIGGISGWLYLAVVMDLCSRKIVGWALGKRMTADLAVRALQQAVAGRSPEPGLILHTDQGSQYGSFEWREYLKTKGIRPSMSRRGNCLDNAAQESFFRSLKTECIRGRSYLSVDEARQDIFDYVEMFYNPKRLHSHLGYLSPDEFEKKLAS